MTKNFHYKNNRFQQLKGFCYTVQTGSMSKAAKKMRLSQGAVSLQIQSLERDLGVELFTRGKNKAVLTREGKVFYTYAAPHIYCTEGLFEDFVALLKKEKSQTISIAANHVSICHILPKYIKKFEEKYPSVQFVIKNLVKKDALRRLADDEVDMLIYSTKLDEIPDELDFIPIVEYQPILLTRKDHPLALKKKITMSDIKKYSLLRLDRQFSTLPNFDEVAKHYGLKTKIEFEMANYEILKKFVQAGIGIAIMSSICLEEDGNGDLISRNLRDYFSGILYGVLIKRGKRFHGLTHDFIEMLKSEKLLRAQV